VLVANFQTFCPEILVSNFLRKRGERGEEVFSIVDIRRDKRMASVFPHTVTAVLDSRQRLSTKELLTTAAVSTSADSARQQQSSGRDQASDQQNVQQNVQFRSRTAAALVQPIRQILYRLAA